MTERQTQKRLNDYFEQHWSWGDGLRAEWYVNPAPNKWRFKLDGETITLTCNNDGTVVVERGQVHQANDGFLDRKKITER